MYAGIAYELFSSESRQYFHDSVFILSGLFGLLKPMDLIPNYKLPIEASGLVSFWKNKMTKALKNMEDVIFVDVLPQSYRKMIDWKKIPNYVTVEFVDDNGTKLGHTVKATKGKWLHEMIQT